MYEVKVPACCFVTCNYHTLTADCLVAATKQCNAMLVCASLTMVDASVPQQVNDTVIITSGLKALQQQPCKPWPILRPPARVPPQVDPKAVHQQSNATHLSLLHISLTSSCSASSKGSPVLPPSIGATSSWLGDAEGSFCCPPAATDLTQDLLSERSTCCNVAAGDTVCHHTCRSQCEQSILSWGCRRPLLLPRCT